MSATYLVTGGAGFIGSHIVHTLVSRGQQVRVLDDFSTGQRANLEPVINDIELVEADVRDRAVVEEAARGVDYVLHQAALPSVAESVADPLTANEVNVRGTLNVLVAARDAGVKQLVLASSCAIYGNDPQLPKRETMLPTPSSPYAATKLAGESYCAVFSQVYGLPTVCLRYFNAAGADPEGELGEDHHPERHLIPLALRAARGGPPLQVFGADYPTPDGTCLRDYVHVADLARAHLQALAGLEAGRASTVYNLGNGRPHSVREVISSVERVTGRAVPHALAPRRAGDPAVLFASSARIKGDLGWAPRYEDLDTIVRTAWAWMEAHPGGYGEARP